MAHRKNQGSDLRIKAIGSGSKGNAYCVKSSRGGWVLLDCGLPMGEIRSGLDNKLSWLEGCLITHQHKDHCLSLRNMLKRCVECYALEEVYKSQDISTAHGFANVIRPDGPFYVGGLSAYPFRVKHPVPNIGFLLNDGTNRVAYITDAGCVYQKLPGVTHLMVEANHDRDIARQNMASGRVSQAHGENALDSHMDIDQTCRLIDSLVDPDLKEVWLIHLSSANSHAKGFQKRIQRLTGVPVYVA